MRASSGAVAIVAAEATGAADDRLDGPPRRVACTPSGLVRPFIGEYLRQSPGELSKVAWPSSGALRINATVLLLTLVVVIVGLGVVELAAGTLARGLFA